MNINKYINMLLDQNKYHIVSEYKSMFCFKGNRKGIAIINLETNKEVWFKKQNIFSIDGIKNNNRF